MEIIVGCEESQAVTIELRKLGHEAFSCDLQDCSGGHPEWHLKMDVFEAIELRKWDMGIFFPDCTYLTISANKWYKDMPPRKSGTLVGAERREAREKAIDFFMKLYNCKIPKVSIENPIGVMSSRFRKPDQVLQPWMFGHGETKATCLWLKNLPKLTPTNITEEREQRIFKLPPSKDRAKLRSKTFPGIAKAMAIQWTKTTKTKPMKTYKDITHLNYQELQFFTGKDSVDCKFEIAKVLEIKEVTVKGIPKVKSSDKAPVDKLDFTIRSNSHLEGADQMMYLVDYYNKGCTISKLQEFAEQKTFIKKLKFTGKFDILNRIMNPDQYRKLQERWLFSNVYGKTKFSKEASEFIEKNQWANDYLKEKGILK